MRRFLLGSLIIFLLISMAINLTFAKQRDEGIRTDISVCPSGKIVHRCADGEAKAWSKNGSFWCQYEIGHVSDEVRELLDFKLLENDQLRLTMERAPGSDVHISNSGIVAFVNMRDHYKDEVTISFYSKHGQYIYSETFYGAFLFGFSPKGERFVVGTTAHLYVIPLPDGCTEAFEKGFQFDISEDGQLLAVASPNRVKVYFQRELLWEIETGLFYARKIKISCNNERLAVIDKKNLQVYTLADGHLAFVHILRGKESYRGLVFERGRVLSGVHHRQNGVSRGILRAFNQEGEVIFEKGQSVKEYQTFNHQSQKGKFTSKYEQIPWPFVPFDQIHTVWNFYEQHMGGWGAEWSYLHQGLDIITPIGEPTFAVAGGIVKCVLTLGGPHYWRIAISKEQTAGRSKGWLYAHLIENTIQFDVGDTVQIHDYLGDIIQWHEDWGHIHFVEIQDSGLVWQYDDDEWGISYNPLLSLEPDTDFFPPIIENVFLSSKFGFCLNETSIYLDPDSLYGDIDIIARIKDYVGYSEWEQPAFETHYWVKKMPEGELVFRRTLGQILNHSYDFYESEHYEPYATLLYKRDEFLIPSSWMDVQRSYYHILTNNNGDSLAELSEKDLAFSTTDYSDGDYRIFVEASDEYGNSSVDSMDVKFRNGIVGVMCPQEMGAMDFYLARNYPNPFNSYTNISFQLPERLFVNLSVYNVVGQLMETLVDREMQPGFHCVEWNGSDYSSGVYLYRIAAGKYSATGKCLLLE